MTPKELLFSALRHETTERAPWVPFAGVHAGKLIGADATEILTDEDTLVTALLEVNKLYKPDGQPVVFDLQLEAEILGCELVWSKEGPPSVASHPLADTMTVPCLCTLPKPEQGRLPMVLSAMRRMKEAVGETTALYGLICGPFTLASHLRGNDIFMDMFDDEDYVKELLAYCTECGKRMSDMFLDAGMDVIAVVDPLVSQISSEHFEEFLSEPFTDLFAHIRKKGAFSSFFVCGNATRNIEVMCKTKPDSLSVDENVDIMAAKAITDKYNVAIGGNIPLTSVMLHGTQQDNMKYVVDMLAKLPENRNFIVAPGCDMPYDVPIENSIGVTLQKAQIKILPSMTYAQLNSMLTMLSEDTYRIKGFVLLAEGKYLVNCVGPAVEVIPYSGADEEIMGKLVLLAGKGMPLRKSLKQAAVWYGDYIEETEL